MSKKNQLIRNSTAEALSYNALIQSWPEIVRLAQEKDRPPVSVEGDLFVSP